MTAPAAGLERWRRLAAALGFLWRIVMDLLCVLPFDLWCGPAIAAAFVARGWPASKAAYMAALPRLL